jgi:Uncharacterized protein conserved in bacteria
VSHSMPQAGHQPVDHRSRAGVRSADLAYTSLRIGVEYDGDWHAMTQEHDQERRMVLARNEWAVVVAYKEDLDVPDRLVREVQQRLQERRASMRRRW